MVNKYTIKVNNRSGDQQHYALFNKAPLVTGRVQSQIWSNVFATGNTPSNGVTTFVVYNQYRAIVASSSGSPSEGVDVDVTSERAIDLGSIRPDGQAIPGTTLEFVVQDDAPQFGDRPLPNTSYPNAFEIQTGNDFTIADARKGYYLIGLGASQSGGSLDAPTASFIPEPGVQYQIQPVNTWYLAVGDFRKGTLVDVNRLQATTAAIDFTRLPSNVEVVHDDHGRLDIQS